MLKVSLFSLGQTRSVEITLGPLYLPDIRELIASVLEYSKSTIDDFLCTEIYQKTGGLPVYVTELLEDLKRNKAVALNEDGMLRLTAEGQIEKVRSVKTVEGIFVLNCDSYIIFLVTKK